ncbi:MAG: hypothetical protein S4CHLAM102_14960 [Chlamydiia bacterium]|nr:hypothetical protein [Chlamydiia bacterium]
MQSTVSSRQTLDVVGTHYAEQGRGWRKAARTAVAKEPDVEVQKVAVRVMVMKSAEYQHDGWDRHILKTVTLIENPYERTKLVNEAVQVALDSPTKRTESGVRSLSRQLDRGGVDEHDTQAQVAGLQERGTLKAFKKASKEDRALVEEICRGELNVRDGTYLAGSIQNPKLRDYALIALRARLCEEEGPDQQLEAGIRIVEEMTDRGLKEKMANLLISLLPYVDRAGALQGAYVLSEFADFEGLLALKGIITDMQAEDELKEAEARGHFKEEEEFTLKELEEEIDRVEQPIVDPIDDLVKEIDERLAQFDYKALQKVQMKQQQEVIEASVGLCDAVERMVEYQEVHVRHTETYVGRHAQGLGVRQLYQGDLEAELRALEDEMSEAGDETLSSVTTVEPSPLTGFSPSPTKGSRKSPPSVVRPGAKQADQELADLQRRLDTLPPLPSFVSRGQADRPSSPATEEDLSRRLEALKRPRAVQSPKKKEAQTVDQKVAELA